MKKVKCKINLIPKHYINEQNAKKSKYIISGILILECMLFIGIFIVPSRLMVREKEKQLVVLESVLSQKKYQEVQEQVTKLREAQELQKVWEEKYKDLKCANFISGSRLDSVLSRVPTGVVINKLLMGKGEENDKNSIYIEGEGKTSEAVFAYVTNIENTYGSQSVNFTMAQDEIEEVVQGDRVNYIITINGE